LGILNNLPELFCSYVIEFHIATNVSPSNNFSAFSD
jgi:hypothetical protein